MQTQELLDILACPRCMGKLEAVEENQHVEGYACSACKVVYPVRNEIPVMLVDGGVPQDRWDKGVRYNSKEQH